MATNDAWRHLVLFAQHWTRDGLQGRGLSPQPERGAAIRAARDRHRRITSGVIGMIRSFRTILSGDYHTKEWNFEKLLFLRRDELVKLPIT